MVSKSIPFSDGLPSYSESVRSPQQHPSRDPSSSYLPRNIAAARTALISSILTAQITPHLHGSALSGLTSTTLVLIPSNVSALQPPCKIGSKSPSDSEDRLPKETIVGFPSAENLTTVRLRGQENNIEFWRQLAVIRELGQQLSTNLRNSGHRVIGDDEISLRGPTRPNAEWKTVQKKTLGDGEVTIRVEIMDICLRTENEMGLYETRTGKAVVVKVDVGG